MANYNRVILAGNLTRDPQLSYTPSNTPICKFGMAINRRWRDQQGNMQEETCFVDCTAFGRTAETINQYMSKGRPILVEGRLDQPGRAEAQQAGSRGRTFHVRRHSGGRRRRTPRSFGGPGRCCPADRRRNAAARR